MFFANSGLYAIQQIGITGAVGGIFAIVYLITLLAIIIASVLLLCNCPVKSSFQVANKI